MCHGILNLVIFNMKKKFLILIGIIVLVIIGLLSYFVISDLMVENKLKNEIYEINEMSNADTIDTDAIYKRLNKIVTKNDYAKVEKAFKQYLKDTFDNILRISEILEDERLVTLLTADNYKKDGKDFVESKKYINETKEELEKCKEKYNDFFKEEKAMSYIYEYDLDTYYIDLYKNEYVGDIEHYGKDKTVENSINEVIELLNISSEILNFLSDNKVSWNLDGENIVFNNDILSSEYDSLLDQLS